MANPLYDDIQLDQAGISRVRDWLREVDFHLPGGTPDDFTINPKARYIGYMFQQESLEAYAIGLRPTLERHARMNTFIRMSRGQLLGDEHPLKLPVNEPVLAREAMTMRRYWESPLGPASTGIDAFSQVAEPGELPGGNQDLDMLEKTLDDAIDFHEGRPVYDNLEILDLRVYWGTLMAGRYPRLKHFQQAGKLSVDQEQRLTALEGKVREYASDLDSMGLATLERLNTKPVIDG
ncbi:hypothetical protein ACXZ66_09845 [Corynebacterium sp. S7]